MASSSETIVLISGANQGIGLEISKKLAAENPSYHVLMGCRSLSKGETAASSFSELSIEPIELDISSDSSISKAFATVQEKFGHLDVLINNAGIGIQALPEGLTTRQRYAQIMDTNAISASYLFRSIIPLFITFWGGRETFFAS